MRIALEVEYRDGQTTKCVADYPDLVAFEEKFNRSVLRLNSELRLKDLGFMAWHALHRENKIDAEYEAWSNTVAIVRSSDDEVEIVPLEQ